MSNQKKNASKKQKTQRETVCLKINGRSYTPPPIKSLNAKTRQEAINEVLKDVQKFLKEVQSDSKNKMDELKKKNQELEQKVNDQKEQEKLDSKEFDPVQSDHQNQVNRLKEEIDDQKEAISYYQKEQEKLENSNKRTTEMMIRLVTAISDINNDVLDDKCDTSIIKEHIEHLKKLMTPLGFDLYVYNRGDIFSNEDASKAEVLYFKHTDDKDCDHAIFRCEQFGFDISEAKVRERAKIQCYQYDVEKRDIGITERKNNR